MSDEKFCPKFVFVTHYVYKRISIKHLGKNLIWQNISSEKNFVGHNFRHFQKIFVTFVRHFFAKLNFCLNALLIRKIFTVSPIQIYFSLFCAQNMKICSFKLYKTTSNFKFAPIKSCLAVFFFFNFDLNSRWSFNFLANFRSVVYFWCYIYIKRRY